MELGTLWTFLASATGSGLVAAFLLLVGYKYLFPDVRENTRRWAKGIGFIFALICAASLLGVPLLSTSTVPAQTAGSYTVTASDALSYVSEDNTAHTVTVAMAYDYGNTTFTGGTGSVVVKFSITRGLGTIGLVQTYVDVSGIPTIVGSNGVSHPAILTVAAAPSAVWNISGVGSATKLMTVNMDQTVSGAIVTLTMTLDPGAAHVLQKYATETIGLTIAGQSWSVVCLMASTISPGSWTGS